MQRPTLILFFFLCLTISVSGQTVDEIYPKTLWCPNDTFTLKLQGVPRLFHYTVSRKDKDSPGQGSRPGAFVTIYYGNDSLRLYYNNKIPYQHNHYVNFESPKGKTTLRYHFNQLECFFSPEYMKKNEGNIQFDIPEAYELANIIWTLSPSGQRATDLPKDTEYYKSVMAYFKPYQNHPVFKSLDFSGNNYYVQYYLFRENSFAFNFQDLKPGSSNTKLLFNGPYYYVWGDELADSSFFGKLKPLVEDFAAKSKFRKFYKDHLDYYKKQIQRERDLLPVGQMWKWLEEQFPKTKYQSYRVVFSPLIGGSHSTQRFVTWYSSNKAFVENVMFICSTESFDARTTLTEKQKEGLMSGIVFTEIDHNYVNPVTNRYYHKVDSAFSDRSIWAKDGNTSEMYSSGESVFNEYMTHSVFCLYINDTYDKPIADFVIAEREKMMVERRNFIRFREFNTELLRLREVHRDLKVVDLYPFILKWCKEQR
jgi:hypothetical protein